MAITRREALLSAGMIAAAGVLPSASQSQPDPPTSPASLGSEYACVTDFEPTAKAKMSPMAWEYINGAAADELTVKWNCEAYQKLRLKPNILVDVAAVDTRVTLFGKEHAFPILLAPTAYHKLAHPEGEIATARGAGAAGATRVISSFATTTLEDLA